MRASATSRIASPAALPQSKPDAGKADDASLFALLLNTVKAKPAAQQKDTQNKDDLGASPNGNGDASGQPGASAAAIQMAPKPVKPGKSDDKSAKSDTEKSYSGRSDGTDAASATAAQQTGAQTQPPPAGPQISIIMATLADGGGDAPDAQPLRSVAASGTDAGAGQTETLDSQAGASMHVPQPLSQADPARAINPPAGQAAGTGAETPAPAANPAQSSPAPSAQTSNPQTQASAVQPEAEEAPVQSTGQSASPQIQPPADPNTVQADAKAPDSAQPASPAPNTVQQAPASAARTPPAVSQLPTNAAQNIVQANVARQTAVPPSSPQTQSTIVAQNTVQPNMDQPAPADGLQVQAAPVQAGRGSDNAQAKAAKIDSDKRYSKSSALPAAAVQALPLQPDPSQVSVAAATATAVVAADQDSGDDKGGDTAGQDAPGIEAASTSSASAGGTAKPEPAKDLQDALTARQQAQPSGLAANSQNTNQPASVQQDRDLFFKPWQAKPQNSGADANSTAKAAAGPTSLTSADQIKQVPTPQAVAASALPVARPADTSGGSMPLLGTLQTPGAQGQTVATAIQTGQVCTASPNIPALAVDIAARSQSGVKQFDIRLDPPELGRVEVRLSIDATGKASAHLSADQPQTLDLLQKDAPVLTRALRDAGLNVSQNGLNFSLRQQQSDAGARTNQRSSGNSRSFTLAATASLDAASAGAAWRAPANGRLDIRV